MGSRKFAYSRRSTLLNLLMIAAMLGVSMALLPVLDVPISSIALLFMLEGILLIVSISPLFTFHEIVDGELVLRHGLFFKGRVPLDNIKSISMRERGPLRTGVFFSLRGSTVFVTTRRYDLIEIELKRGQRFFWTMGKRADRILFDAIEPKEMMDQIFYGRSLPPINA